MNSASFTDFAIEQRLKRRFFVPRITTTTAWLNRPPHGWGSLAKNHPFIDGNKRIAFSAADTFLARNGFYLDVGALKTYRFMMKSIAGSTFRFGPILDWINASIKPLP